MGPRIGQKSALALKGHPEAARGPSGGLLGPFGDQFWVTFGPHLGPILELPEADFRATATATAATAVATPTTTATATATARASGPSALEPLVLPQWSGASAPLEHTGTKAATASWSFAFELLDQGSWALALEGLGL